MYCACLLSHVQIFKSLTILTEYKAFSPTVSFQMTSCVTKEVPISCTIDLNTVNNILPEVSKYYPLNVFTEINSLFYMNFFNSNNKTRPIVAKTELPTNTGAVNMTNDCQRYLCGHPNPLETWTLLASYFHLCKVVTIRYLHCKEQYERNEKKPWCL